MSEEKAAELGFKPLGALAGSDRHGLRSCPHGDRTGLRHDQVEKQNGLILRDAAISSRSTRAFAAQTLAVVQCASFEHSPATICQGPEPLGKHFPWKKLNVNGWCHRPPPPR